MGCLRERLKIYLMHQFLSCLLTTYDDYQLSSFVQWIISGCIRFVEPDSGFYHIHKHETMKLSFVNSWTFPPRLTERLNCLPNTGEYLLIYMRACIHSSHSTFVSRICFQDLDIVVI